MPKKRDRQRVAAQNAELRKLYVAARKKGLVRDQGPAKSFKPSKYMKTRLRQLEPYLGPDYAVVKASPQLVEAWKGAPSSIVPVAFNRKLVVKKAEGVKISTKGGVLAIRKHLKAGTYEQLPLPVNASNLQEFREWIRVNRYYNDILKHRDEVFNFRIYGNDSYNSFGDIEALLAELEKYDNFEPQDWDESEQFYRHFELFRSYKDWTGSEHAEQKRQYVQKKRQEAKQRKYNRMTAEQKAAFDDRQRELVRARRRTQKGYRKQKVSQREKRKNETAEERAKRLAKERARDAKRRAAKRSDE